MKFGTGMDALIASLTGALIIGAVATAQQQSGQQSQTGQAGQTQPKKPDASTAPDRSTTQTDTTRGTDKDRDAGAYSRQGMYNEYRRHWDARFHDPAFMTFHKQQMEKFNANRTQNQAQAEAARNPAERPGQQRTPMTYDQFSGDSKLWTDRNSAQNAWQRSDAYWRMSDRYWRDPSRRNAEGFDDYWKKSDEYWNDSSRYWDMNFDNFDNLGTAEDRERTNR